MGTPDLYSHLIHVSLTLNSSTLYSYENPHLVQLLNNLHCSEIISQELGVINASKTLVGSIPVSSTPGAYPSKLVLYFMKRTQTSADGSQTDLITMVVIAHAQVNRALVLTVMKRIIEAYLDFRKQGRDSKRQLGEFKVAMNAIIKREEQTYDSNHQLFSYGATNDDGANITPNQLVLANEEVNEVRELMLDNINKILDRGERIDSLVDQTAQLSTSSVVFYKKAQQIKRHMWTQRMKFTLMVSAIFAVIVYLVIGANCGYPLWNQCFA